MHRATHCHFTISLTVLAPYPQSSQKDSLKQKKYTVTKWGYVLEWQGQGEA